MIKKINNLRKITIMANATSRHYCNVLRVFKSFFYIEARYPDIEDDYTDKEINEYIKISKEIIK